MRGLRFSAGALGLRRGAWRAACWVGLAWLLAACSSDQPRPAPLLELPTSAVMRPTWSYRLGKIAFPMRMVAVGGTVYAASSDGDVLALDLETGRERWRAAARANLTAGVGSDGRFVAVVTQKNELLVFEQARLAWRATLPSPVTTAPLVAGERVFVQGLDRAVLAFDALDGRKLWAFQRPGDALTLQQFGVLQPIGNTLWVGSGPRLVALDSLTGTAQQDVVVGSPRGGNEVERLADLVGPAAREGAVLCVRAFQTSVACARARTAELLWSRPYTGSQGVAVGGDYVVAADGSDRLMAWWRSSGEVAWRSDSLVYRGLSAPTVVANQVAFGDSDGYVHLLALSDGRIVKRLLTQGDGISAPLVSAQGWLLAASKSGEIDAFRVESAQ